MSNLTVGDRVCLKSNVFNLPANLAGIARSVQDAIEIVEG